MEQASGRDRARLCCLNEFSLAWLDVCPTAANGLRLQPSEFCVLNKLFLGEPILPLNTALICEACAESMDAYGDHLLCCRKSGFIQRHQTIVEQLWHFCNPFSSRTYRVVHMYVYYMKHIQSMRDIQKEVREYAMAASTAKGHSGEGGNNRTCESCTSGR